MEYDQFGIKGLFCFQYLSLLGICICSSCPFNTECLTLKIINRTDVPNDVNNDKKSNFGLADTPLKKLLKPYKGLENSMKIALNWLRQLERSNINFSIKYSIASKVHLNQIICQLCFPTNQQIY